MNDRLPSHVLVSALMRRTHDAGGSAMVLAKGEATGGAILVVVADPGGPERLLERGLGATGAPALIDSTPVDNLADYWMRRRSRDPDLWVVELIVPAAERLVAETLTPN